MLVYTWTLFPNDLSRHSLSSRVCRNTVDYQRRAEMGTVLCWCGMVGWLNSLGAVGQSRSLDQEVPYPALKIKQYWLKSDTVTFHRDGIDYSEKRSNKYSAVCL
jgi:hypothetical protein